MSKTILMLGVALAIAGAHGAHAEVMSTRMSCIQVEHAVQQYGAVHLATSPLTNDTYVNSKAYCAYDQDLRPQWVPTKDMSRCFVGYTCSDNYINGGGGN